MPVKFWKDFEPGECHRCGSDLEILTDATLNGEVFGCDGDSIQCGMCAAKGYLVVQEDGDFYVEWGTSDA